MRKVQGTLGLTCLIALPFIIALSSVLSSRKSTVPKKDTQCGIYAPEGQTVCPLGLCCSRYGYCGSDELYCGLGCQSNCNPEDERLTTSNNSTPSTHSTLIRNVAYYESWASVRPCDAYLPHQIDPSPWTHINFAFALVDQSGNVVLSKANDTILYEQMQGLREKKKDLKLYIAIGGFAVGAGPFAKLAATSTGRSDFIKSACTFADKHGFDGVDIDWEYPADVATGGTNSDTANFVSLVQEFRQQCQSKALTVTVPGGLYSMKGFDLKGMDPYVDWFNLMAYDLHGSWEKPETARPHTGLKDISQSLQAILNQGVDPDKVVLGLAYYGRTWTLKTDSCKTPGCPATGPGKAGPCSLEAGTLIDSEINGIIADYSIHPSIDEETAVKYFAWDETQWVTYDDAETIALKKSWANKERLGGTMVWAVDMATASI